MQSVGFHDHPYGLPYDDPSNRMPCRDDAFGIDSLATPQVNSAFFPGHEMLAQLLPCHELWVVTEHDEKGSTRVMAHECGVTRSDTIGTQARWGFLVFIHTIHKGETLCRPFR